MKKTLTYILVAIVILFLGVIAFLVFSPDPDVTPQTKVFIQNNSKEQPTITVEYKSSVCPEICKLELGRFGIGEGRSTLFPNPTQGTFKVSAKFISGTTLTSEEQLASPEEYTAMVTQDNVRLSK